MPIAASSSATSAKPASTRACTERDAVCLSTMSRIDRTSEIGCCGSTRWMMPRIGGASGPSGTLALTTRSFGV